eukprot:TRINITY_DN9395_c1_g1_i1.p2 TRINITY_DN9395_c1_g1~~TRINITY_DN9395_c1_g1_i1.p2  ORF type:complete len:121 (-),score=12.19 TRINITY_DN9395_c1_g1_i1:139-501(-)
MVPWVPDIEDVLGRPLSVTDRAGGSPHVVVALGRACALPLDVSNWERMDDPSLMVSVMRSAVAVSSLHRFSHRFSFDSSIRFSTDFIFISQVMQKCHVSLGGMERAEARAAEWAAEKERL